MKSTVRSSLRLFAAACAIALAAPFRAAAATACAVGIAVKSYCMPFVYQVADDLRGLATPLSAFSGSNDAAVAGVALVAAKQFVLRILRRIHHKQQTPYLWGSTPV